MIEAVVAVAVGALVAVFIGCALVIAFVIKKKICLKQDLITQNHAQNNPDIQLINEDPEGNSAVTLEDVLHDDLWIDDMSGVFGHALPILRGCHNLTLKLVTVTVKECKTDGESQCIEEMARRVNPRLEDVVQMLDGPLDPRLVEARCTALVLSVSNLVLVVKSICRSREMNQWVEEHTMEIETHLQELRALTVKRRNTVVSEDSGRGEDNSATGSDCSGAPSSRASSSNTEESGIHDVQVHTRTVAVNNGGATNHEHIANGGNESSMELHTVTTHIQS